VVKLLLDSSMVKSAPQKNAGLGSLPQWYLLGKYKMIELI
jgi:hypothetical protein